MINDQIANFAQVKGAALVTQPTKISAIAGEKWVICVVCDTC